MEKKGVGLLSEIMKTSTFAKIYLILSIFGVLLFFIIFNSVNALNINSCQNLSIAGYYNLTGNLVGPDVNSSGCFFINQSNIEINCNNFYIFNSSIGYAGISARNCINITIRNCNITLAGPGASGGSVEFNNVNYSRIVNLIGNDNDGSLTLINSNNNNLSNLRIDRNSNAIALTNSSNNIFNGTYMQSNYEVGISLVNSSNNSFYNITSINNTIGITLTNSSFTLINSGIFNNQTQGIFSSNSFYFVLRNIIANFNFGSGPINGTGVFLDDTSNYCFLDNITANYNGYVGVALGSGTRYCNLSNIATNNNSGGGFFMENSLDSMIINLTSLNNSGFGIWLWANCTNNSFTNVNSSNNNVGLIVEDQSSLNDFTDSIFLYNTGYDLNLTDNSSDNYFLNDSYNVSKEYVENGTSLIKKWYYKSYVNDSSGNPISGAVLNFYNSSSINLLSLTTNSSGWTDTALIIEYVNNGVRNYYSNYTIIGSATGLSGSKTYNVSLNTNNLNDFLTLGSIAPETSYGGGGGIIYTCNFSCSDWSNCVDINGSGIQTRTCNRILNCNIPVEKINCTLNKTLEIEIPDSNLNDCTEWSRCRVVYNMDDILAGNVFLSGEKGRICIDLDGREFIERMKCNSRIDVRTKKNIWCFDEYLEVYDLNDSLISRIQMTGKRLNIDFSFENKTFCAYCFDGIKDYDEDDTDCSYSENGNCPFCKIEEKFIENKCRNYYLTALFIVLFSLILVFLILFFIKYPKKR